MDEQFYNITRSYSRKLNFENHGIDGKRFEMEEFFASHAYQIPIKEATTEKVAEISSMLFDAVKAEVDYAIDQRIAEVRNSQIKLSGKELAEIAEYIQRIASGDIEGATKMINENKDKINKNQLEFLRTLARSK